jgi:hypothetical protein
MIASSANEVIVNEDNELLFDLAKLVDHALDGPVAKFAAIKGRNTAKIAAQGTAPSCLDSTKVVLTGE